MTVFSAKANRDNSPPEAIRARGFTGIPALAENRKTASSWPFRPQWDSLGKADFHPPLGHGQIVDMGQQGLAQGLPCLFPFHRQGLRLPLQFLAQGIRLFRQFRMVDSRERRPWYSVWAASW